MKNISILVLNTTLTLVFSAWTSTSSSPEPARGSNTERPKGPEWDYIIKLQERRPSSGSNKNFLAKLYEKFENRNEKLKLEIINISYET